MAISVVIPTLNEEGNIGDVIQKVKEADEEREIVVVDDESSDNTREIAREHGANVIHRKEPSDLSRSILTGIKASKYNKVIVLDGDGQHPPEKIPEISAELDKNDVVVGAREEVVGDWGVQRKALSVGAQIGAEILFKDCRKTSDCVSGFFGVRKDRTNIEYLRPRGYKILIEILVLSDGEVSEVPFKFYQRVNGESSIDSSSVLDFLAHVFELKFRELSRHGAGKAVIEPITDFIPWITSRRSGALQRF